MPRPIALLALAAIPALPLAAQTAPRIGANGFAFTIDNMMRGPELFGREPTNVRWSSDGKWIYFSWLEPGASWREPLRPYRVRAVPGAKPERISTVQMDSAGASVAGGRLSPDRRWRAVASSGDLYLVDANTGGVKRLTETLGAESDPSFSADGRQLYYLRDGNVFALTLDGGLTRQLTDLRPPTGGPATPPKPTGQRSALQSEQRTLLEAVRDRLWQDSVAAADRAALRPSLKTLTLLPNERAGNVAVSPTARALVV